jgi:ABC-type Na+ efflux pump permease subunit
MKKPLLVVCCKEVLENARDRRTVFSTLFFGPLFAPVLFAVLINVMLSQTLTGMDQPIEIPIIGAEHAPNLVGFLERSGIGPVANGPASQDAARAAVARGDHEVAIVIDANYPEAFRSAGDARVLLVVDHSQSSATATSQRVRAGGGSRHEPRGAHAGNAGVARGPGDLLRQILLRAVREAAGGCQLARGPDDQRGVFGGDGQ